MLGVSPHHVPHQSLRPYVLHCHGVQCQVQARACQIRNPSRAHIFLLISQAIIIIITRHLFKIVLTEPYKHWRRFFFFQFAAFCSMLFSLSLRPTNEVVAHSQIIVPHGDLQGFLCQLVQGHIILKLLCRQFR